MMPELTAIQNPNTSQRELLLSLVKLSNEAKIEEPSSFWTDIANETTFSEDHRRRAVFMLFKRHVKPKVSLLKLSKELQKPNWLKLENIDQVQALGGKIPVEFNFDDSIFSIAVFENLPEGRYISWAIYFRIEGKITAQELYDILSSEGEKGTPELKKRKLLEYALSPPDPEVFHD